MRYEYSRSSPDAPVADGITVYREASDPRLTDKRTGWAPVHPAAHRLLYWLKLAMQAEQAEGVYSTVVKASTSTLKAKHKPCTASGDVPYLYVKRTGAERGFFVMHDDSVQAGAAWQRDGRIAFRIERESAPAVRKLADKFAGEFVQAFAAGEVPAPSGADCWGCCMFDRASGGKHSMQHVAGHVAERYFVPSLLVNAVQASGNRWMPSMLAQRWQYGRAPSPHWCARLCNVLAHYVEAALVREAVQSAADLPAVDC